MDVRGFFVTGTDTEIGKTVASLALLERLAEEGFETAAMKPVASGCAASAASSGGLRNDDALRLGRAATADCRYEDVNPYAFEPPIAPHLAARLAGRRIEQAVIDGRFRNLCAPGRVLVVEGVGGWLVPLSETRTVADLARDLGLPVVLVVGLKLGCLNHALLSERAITGSGCRLAGWVANRRLPGFELAERNVEALVERMASPLLGVLSHVPDPLAAPPAGDLDWPLLRRWLA